MPDNSSKSAVVECPCKVIPLFYSTRTVANLGMEFLLRATLRGFFSPALQAPTPAPFHPERRVRDPIGPFCARQGAANPAPASLPKGHAAHGAPPAPGTRRAAKFLKVAA